MTSSAERGRPKSPYDLDAKQVKQIIEMYRVGASDTEVKAFIHDQRGTFSNDLWDRWLEEEEDFSEAIMRGRMLAAAWWESQGRFNLKEREFNTRCWEINMKNRFGWSDKQQVENSGKQEVTFGWKQ